MTAAYDQGSSIKSNVDSSVLSTLTFLSSHGRNQMAIVATTFAIISFVIALSIKRIRCFKKRLELSIFAFKILKELVSVRSKLKDNIMSQKIFPLESWISKDQAERRHVFDDYGDYKYIDTFYEKLKERDENLLNKNTAASAATAAKSDVTINANANEVRRYNEECLTLASETIENINWTHYQDAEDRKYYLPLTVLITIPCALLVFAAVEMYKVPFVLFDLGLPNQYHIMLYFIFAFAQTLVAFLLAREIINFRTSFSYEIGIDNNFLSYYTLSRREQVKLLVLSFVIVGIPILSILHGFQFTIKEFDYPSIYEIVIGILFDTARFFILVFVPPKFIMKRQVQLRT